MKTALTEREELIAHYLEEGVVPSEIVKRVDTTIKGVQGAKAKIRNKLLRQNTPESVARAIRIDQIVHARWHK